jgi:hypothetical protein
MTITRRLAVGVVLAGAAIGLAGPASADPLSGSYTETVVSGGFPGLTRTFIATACGPDCAHLEWSVPGIAGDLHPQGDSWAGTRNTLEPDIPCAVTINMKSLVETDECGSLGNTHWQLTRNG